ncbi:Protein of unknown function [Cotesia congregata]|uniref:Uncharacterized protein n=1 Tax=Cotesia congregata TaxID=51543 RepID=A0A8J2EDR4_COTCN|nr:Protein of unknown function [Cotesia congregata]
MTDLSSSSVFQIKEQSKNSLNGIPHQHFDDIFLATFCRQVVRRLGHWVEGDEESDWQDSTSDTIIRVRDKRTNTVSPQ